MCLEYFTHLVCHFALHIVYRYPKSKYVAVLMITIGISMATIASAQQAVNIYVQFCESKIMYLLA